MLFIRVRPPPQSTLFPYTTLFRSGELPGQGLGLRPRLQEDALDLALRQRAEDQPPEQGDVEEDEQPEDQGGDEQPARQRSEEHTSELQSQSNLVCRLLLEKKKTTK